MIVFYHVHKKLFEIFICIKFPLISQNAARDNADMVGCLLHLGEHMAGEDDGDAFCGKGADQRPKLLDSHRVKSVGRLVEDEQLGVTKQCKRNPKTLLHAKRELSGSFPAGIREADGL